MYCSVAAYAINNNGFHFGMFMHTLPLFLLLLHSVFLLTRLSTFSFLSPFYFHVEYIPSFSFIPSFSLFYPSFSPSLRPCPLLLIVYFLVLCLHPSYIHIYLHTKTAVKWEHAVSVLVSCQNCVLFLKCLIFSLFLAFLVFGSLQCDD